MTAVVFYEKPGCRTNARQKALLARCGCRLVVRDLLSEPWTAERLYGFLRHRPVAEWFNPAARQIKTGRLKVEGWTAEAALRRLVEEPILIRRPLLASAFGRTAGFDDSAFLARLGVAADPQGADEACSKPANGGPCWVPEAGDA
ncbi:MAG: ArsC/Spx/MgsR family protein [Pseudomonadota bacterium]|nr:ArsC/Spx/MgsR family protein [Pseudomonadota bacterium]